MNMLKTLPLALLLAAGAAQAQSAGGPCPSLVGEPGLAWEHTAGPDFDFCRALDADGQQVLGVYVGEDSPFRPNHRNRAESGQIDGRQVTWYRSEVAGQPDVEVRETLLVLADGRVAHVWLRASSAAELQQDLRRAEGLSFQPVRLGSQ
jgi:hypothetical protein